MTPEGLLEPPAPPECPPSPPGEGSRGGSPPAGFPGRLEANLDRLLAAIGEAADLTFFRGPGNRGDDLIAAGTRRLLSALPYREAGVEDAPRLRGHTALLGGGGAWCHPYHEVMPAVLRRLERRFSRVIVLPSSFDLGVREVREVLASTRALVFAREPASLRQLRTACEADLALDCAFFFDFSPYRLPGRGTLHAYRTDRESTGAFPLPDDNADISLSCSSLDEWLWTIARHRIVRTDRAHVMIAAALLGKEVRYRPSSYHKLPAIAAWALAGFPVTAEGEPDPVPGPGPPRRRRWPRPTPEPALDEESVRRRLAERAREGLSLLPAAARDAAGEPRVTAVLLSHDREQRILAALESLAASSRIPLRILVVDNGSRPEVGAALEDWCSGRHRCELIRLPMNLGAAGGRRLALERLETEYVLFLDDDAEVFPGTVEHLVHALDSHPRALAATANVVLPDGRVHLCGGRLWERWGILHFELLGAGRPFDDPALGTSGTCSWTGFPCTAVRTAALSARPLDQGMTTYYEDLEWCYRVRREDGAFLRCVEALALHHHEPKHPAAYRAFPPARSMPYAQAISRFYQLHGLIIQNLFDFIPELTSFGGRPRVRAARLFLELVAARGSGWVLEAWESGELAPLLEGDRLEGWARSAWWTAFPLWHRARSLARARGGRRRR